MEKLIDTYVTHLSAHPNEIHAIILWTVTNILVYVILFKTEKERIEGSKGLNKLWETAEQIIHILSWVMCPLVSFAIFFRVDDMIGYAWLFLIGMLAYGVGGRWIFDWALAVKNGSKTVTETVATTEHSIEKKIEVSQETTK